MKNSNLMSFLAVVLIIFMSSCAGSKRFNYADAYKFKTIKYGPEISEVVEIPVQAKPIESKKLTAAQEVEPLKESITEKLQNAEEKILGKLDLAETEATELDRNEIIERVNNLSAREKRELRREVRKDLKEIRQLTKEVEAVNETMDVQKTNELEGNMRLGVIIGVSGLILVILGSIVLWPLAVIGGLAMIAGLILILIEIA